MSGSRPRYSIRRFGNNKHLIDYKSWVSAPLARFAHKMSLRQYSTLIDAILDDARGQILFKVTG